MEISLIIPHETNLGIAYSIDYDNKTCYYHIGDKVALFDINFYNSKMTEYDMYEEVKKHCVKCEVIGLSDAFIRCDFKPAKNLKNKQHDKITIMFPSGEEITVNPNYFALIGKLNK